jgi:hypothetical protein
MTMWLLSLLALLAATSVCGDVLHALLHVSMHRKGILSVPGQMHQAHHRFLDTTLAFHDERFWQNVAQHQFPEFLMRSLIAAGVGSVFGVDDAVIGTVVVIAAVDFVVAVANRGRDAFHRATRPGPPADGLFVDAAYHAHHHLHPDHFVSAHLQVVDRLLGRLLPLADRRVVITGGSAFCADLAAAVSAAGAVVVRVAADAVADADFSDADIVVLGHGADVRGRGAYEAVVAAALAAKVSGAPLDVWAVGSSAPWDAAAMAFSDRAIIRRLRRAPMLGARTTLGLMRRGARDV